MNIITTNGAWTVSKAQNLFTEQQTNEDAAIVDIENKSAAHWFRRWQYLVTSGCPRLVAYDTIAARARKSRKTIQNIVRVYQHFGAEQMEEYEQAGITYLMAAVTRKEPDRFMDEALRHPNTTVDTLLSEFEAEDGQDETRPVPPYRACLWGAARRLATLPVRDKARAERHIRALDAIFERNGID